MRLLQFHLTNLKKISEAKTAIIRMLDYMLGVNPWDISMIYGVGITDYHYRHLVGALQGGYKPVQSNLYGEFAGEYSHAEVECIDGRVIRTVSRTF
ncbi:MAG TPA: hypothetical protein VHO70_14880 [Chitinispirillaceae bacterium]|nr:hypothetical protein [Chitinispirillaceae bacterium]